MCARVRISVMHDFKMFEFFLNHNVPLWIKIKYYNAMYEYVSSCISNMDKTTQQKERCLHFVITNHSHLASMINRWQKWPVGFLLKGIDVCPKCLGYHVTVIQTQEHHCFTASFIHLAVFSIPPQKPMTFQKYRWHIQSKVLHFGKALGISVELVKAPEVNPL